MNPLRRVRDAIAWWVERHYWSTLLVMAFLGAFVVVTATNLIVGIFLTPAEHLLTTLRLTPTMFLYLCVIELWGHRRYGR